MYHLNMEQLSQFFKLEHKAKIDLDNWDLFNCPQHWWHDVMIYMTYWPPTTQTGKVTHTTMGLHRHCSSWFPRVWTTDLFPAWHFLRNHYHDIYSWNTEHVTLKLVMAHTFDKRKSVILLSFHLKRWHS